MSIIPPNFTGKEYDHEDDYEEENKDSQVQVSQHNNPQIQQFEDDYNFAKLNADVHELFMQTKTHDQNLRHLQKEVDSRVTESHLSQVIALINSGIQTDPNLVKLLKTKEAVVQEQTSKSKQNAFSFGKKLNQMNECLSVLLGSIRKLQLRINSVESDLTSQMNEKLNQQQIQVQESRSEQVKENMQLQQKMELMSFELGDKLRDVETKTNWRLSEFKSKIDEKISEQFVKDYCQGVQKRVDQNMRQYQLSSNIHPDRIEAIEQQLRDNYSSNKQTINQCEYQIANIRIDIESRLVKISTYQEQRLHIQKRLDLFNSNFSEVYQRVKTCEAQEKVMSSHIEKLLADTKEAISELQRINTVLINLKIGQDFQRMLEEMNPTKVLELQERVDGVHNDQRSIFRQIELAKREIDKINAKSDIMGVMLPNQLRDKFKKEELDEAITTFLNDHQFTQKLASIDRQLAQYKLSVESINLLTRQVARIQKEDESHRIALQVRNLQQKMKKELLLIHSHLKERLIIDQDKPIGKAGVHALYETSPIGDLSQGRSFSLKKLNKINSVYSCSGSGIRNLVGKERKQ